MCKFMLVVVLIAFAFSNAKAASVIPSDWIVLYENQACTGENVYFPPSTGAIHLGNLGFDNKAQSIKLVGTWLAYDLGNFNKDRDAGMERLSGTEGTCIDLFVVNGTASSIRPIGTTPLGGQNTAAITLYEYPKFQGAEVFLEEDDGGYEISSALGTGGRIYSLIITGTSEWTVYQGMNYDGPSWCLRVDTPGNGKPTFVSDTADIDIPHGNIRSVKKGCSSTNVVIIE